MVDHRSRVALIFILFFCLLIKFTLEQQQELLTSGVEKLALLQLRSSLGLRARDWPIKLDPCLSWKGIQCLNGRVTGINISGFRRTNVGRLNPQFSVDALQNFTLLATFNASNFALPGLIPDWFGVKLVSLQVIDLRSCSIIGSIPSSIGNLSSLTSLYLSDNNLSGVIPASFGQLGSLEILDLSYNSLSGLIPQSLASLKNLTSLNVSRNSLSGTIPPAIGTLSRLKFLNLSMNSLSSLIPAQLGDLSNLVDLDLGFNSLTGAVPPDLQGLRNLQRMVIGNNSLSGPIPAILLPALTQLRFLVVSDNAFTGSLPDVLWSMSQLQFFDASGNNFTGTLPNLTTRVNSTAAVFNLSHNLFYGSITPIVGRFSAVDLSGNYIEGKVPDYAQRKVAVADNCLQNVSNQKSLEECKSFYAKRGLTFDNFGITNSTQPPPPKSKKKSRRTLIILVSVLAGAGVLTLLVILLVLLIVCTRRRGSTAQRDIGSGPVPAGSGLSPPGKPLDLSTLGDAFTYEQILQATSEFSDVNLIKNGHSGDLFRGTLEGGIPIVIKRVNPQSVMKEDYLSELEFYSKFCHPRFVPFLGHCLEHETEKIIVYKFMPNGDLSGSLYKKQSSDDDSLQSLDWITRLKIAIGAAEGLCYLHHECSPPLVHRNVQASSILLDDKFEVRMGSLSEVCVEEGGNHQNRFTRLLRLSQASEQGSSGTANAICAYDVYCFGKVLLELVTGKLGISACSDATEMKDWLDQILPHISIYDKDILANILDPSLMVDEDLLEEVWAMAVVAKSCLNPKPLRRPLMKYILKALENPLKVVREENTSSERLRTTSSRSSWNAATLFGSWRSTSDVAAVAAAPTSSRAEGGSSSGLKQVGTSGSQGSGGGGGGGGDGLNSSSTRRQSNEIFPEPVLDERDVERQFEGGRRDDS